MEAKQNWKPFSKQAIAFDVDLVVNISRVYIELLLYVESLKRDTLKSDLIRNKS